MILHKPRHEHDIPRNDVQHAWSYCALCHDLLDFKLNRVTIHEVAADGDAQQPRKKTYDLDSDDAFWTEHMASAFQVTHMHFLTCPTLPYSPTGCSLLASYLTTDAGLCQTVASDVDEEGVAFVSSPDDITTASQSV